MLLVKVKLPVTYGPLIKNRPLKLLGVKKKEGDKGKKTPNKEPRNTKICVDTQ